VTPDHRIAVLGSEDGTLRVWDLDSGEARTLKGHGGAIRAVAVTSDGRVAVSGSQDCTVLVCNLARRRLAATFHADNTVTSCAVSADGRILAAGDRFGQVHFLRLEGGVGTSG